ncbi:DeoR family transcriptional regulator [bacterium]|nr:DeoR family transcriptional regulator [bacterium]
MRIATVSNRELSDRKQLILHETIKSFIDTAEPVGSKTLSKTSGLAVSPATIRNDLNELEQEGYLTQVHSSSGRIPTDKGYRLYVDQLMAHGAAAEPVTKALADIQFIGKGIQDILVDVSELMGNLIDYTAIVVLMKGVSNMIRLPEFRNVEMTQRVLSALEESKAMLAVLSEYLRTETPKVVIGDEHAIEGLKDCSMVVAPYGADAEPIGMLGVIGPKRMAYDKVVPMVQRISAQINEYLNAGHEPVRS